MSFKVFILFVTSNRTYHQSLHCMKSTGKGFQRCSWAQPPPSARHCPSSGPALLSILSWPFQKLVSSWSQGGCHSPKRHGWRYWCQEGICSFATVTNYHKLWLKQHKFTISQPGGQKSKKGLTGLRSRCRQATFLLVALGENPLSCPIRLPGAACIPWLVASSSATKASSVASINLSLTLTSAFILSSPSLTILPLKHHAHHTYSRVIFLLWDPQLYLWSPFWSARWCTRRFQASDCGRLWVDVTYHREGMKCLQKPFLIGFLRLHWPGLAHVLAVRQVGQESGWHLEICRGSWTLHYEGGLHSRSA